MAWRDGILARIAKEASQEENKAKKYCVVFDNISAAPDALRPILNPILWERMVQIPTRGETLILPANVSLLLTMHQGTQIRDESFMNRPLVQYVGEVAQLDMEVYLRVHAGVAPSIIARLLDLYARISKLPFQDKGSPVGFFDMVQIAKRIKGVALETGRPQEDVLEAEAFNYLYLRMANAEDQKLLGGVMARGRGPEIRMDNKAGELIFDGDKKADAIIEYRKGHCFKKVEDITGVKGLGDKFVEKNKKDLTVGKCNNK